MNKKIIPLVLLSSFLLTGCEFIYSFFPEEEFVPADKDDDEPEAVEFAITSAYFTDEERHLRVNYTCNYDSPFVVTNHEFSKLNITGVTASELDVTHEGYFTLLSPFYQTTLKFEFYDSNNYVYISLRYQNVQLYNPDTPVPPSIDYPEGYSQLYWADEFNGESLNGNKWTYEIGNGSGGWGNNESQYYTNSNDFVSNGVLTIRAKEETINGFNYTSTRIKTQNKVKFTYGYVEARISLPAVTGMWPAFWMMPNDSYYGGWPHSGEIDIMEAKGRFPSNSSSALHFSTSNGDHTYLSNEKTGHNITQFHKYAVEWKEDSIKYYIDDVCHLNIDKYQWTTKNAQGSATAPFDKDFYLILNLAVGGHFDGYSLPPAGFGYADMQVDYVRVFK